MKNRISMDAFKPDNTDKVILDTNILIKLFYPIEFEKITGHYDVLYNKLLSAKSTLLISSVQISEFINRCIRIQFDLYKSEHNLNDLNYKRDYRSTDDYREKMSGILDILKKLYLYCYLHSKLIYVKLIPFLNIEQRLLN